VKKRYQTRKHEMAKAILVNIYGYTEKAVADRKACYRLMATLRYIWDTTTRQWEVQS